jgi:hypothetical protein
MKYCRNLLLSGGLVFVLLLLASCSGQGVYIQERGEYWTARSVDDLKKDIARPDTFASRNNWKETTYPMADGYYGLVEPISKDCAIHWKINPRHRVVGFDTKGDGCDTASSKDLELYNIKKMTTDDTPSNPWK